MHDTAFPRRAPAADARQGASRPDGASEAAAIPPFPLDRRGFLRGVAGGGAAIWLGRLLPAGLPAAAHELAQPGGVLPEGELAVVRAAAAALLEGVPVGADRVVRDVDRGLAAMGEPVVTDIRTVLRLVERLTFLSGHVRPFTALDSADALAYLQGWGRSRFNLRRAAYQALRTLVHFYAWARPETRPVTGFEGPWTERYHYPAYPVDFGEVT